MKNANKNGTSKPTKCSKKPTKCSKKPTKCSNDEIKENNVDLYLDEVTKVRTMALQLYCEPTRWADVLSSAKRYIYIKHDKDVTTPHYHLILQFENPRYRNAVYKLFNFDGLTEDTTINFQKVANLAKIVRYLTHRTREALKANKHVYDEKELVSNDLGYFINVSDNDFIGLADTDKNGMFLDDITNRDISVRELACKYGRDYMKNYHRYREFAYAVAVDDSLREMAEKRTELQKAIDEINGYSGGYTFDELLVNYLADWTFAMYRFEDTDGTVPLSPLSVVRDAMEFLTTQVLERVKEKKI